MDCDHHLSSTWFLDFIILVRIIRAVLQRLPLSSSRDRHHYSSLYLLPDYHVHHKRYYSIYYKLIDEKYEEYINNNYFYGNAFYRRWTTDHDGIFIARLYQPTRINSLSGSRMV